MVGEWGSRPAHGASNRVHGRIHPLYTFKNTAVIPVDRYENRHCVQDRDKSSN